MSRTQVDACQRGPEIRQACYSDHTAIRDFLGGLSLRARYLRFFTGALSTGPAMLRMAGECCDGVFLHPLHSADYLRATALPAVAAGARAAGRERDAVTVCCPVFVAVGETQQEIDRQRAGIARQIAFYGSTRTYRPVFEAHGWGDVCDRLHELLARGDTAAMTAQITGEMLDAYSVAATWEELPGVLARRYGGLVDRVAPYGADLGSASGRERWRALVASSATNRMI